MMNGDVQLVYLSQTHWCEMFKTPCYRDNLVAHLVEKINGKYMIIVNCSCTGYTCMYCALVCVCVCVCAHACACVCLCVCVCNCLATEMFKGNLPSIESRGA